MAVRIGSVGLRLEASGPDLDWLWPLGARVGLGRNCSWIGPAMLARAVQLAINDRLRIGTDKWNPTV